uniref:Uncharacterized protein n=1 Tax=Arundo donax TaxID=35708 RepID=A0A0A8Z7X0_ARUDO
MCVGSLPNSLHIILLK